MQALNLGLRLANIPTGLSMKEHRRVRLEQAAPYASCSIATLRRRIYDGTITGYRSGKRIVLVDLDEIDRKLIRPIAAAKSA